MKAFGVMLLPALLILGNADAVSGQEAAASAAAPVAGQLNEAELGSMLAAIGLVPTKTEQRYDFAFKTSYRGEEWKFSMSAVLSRNNESIWVMAWLDQVPQTANEVPRTALLRLLAANDRLGNGKFFAYIPTNKRFVLQRIVRNEEMTSRKMMEILQDLAASVADEYPIWAVTNWAPKADQGVSNQEGSDRSVPSNPTAASRSAVPVRTSESATKFDGNRIN